MNRSKAKLSKMDENIFKSLRFLVPKTRGFPVPKIGGLAVPKTVINQSLSLTSKCEMMVWFASLSPIKSSNMEVIFAQPKAEDDKMESKLFGN